MADWDTLADSSCPLQWRKRGGAEETGRILSRPWVHTQPPSRVGGAIESLCKWETADRGHPRTVGGIQ